MTLRLLVQFYLYNNLIIFEFSHMYIVLTSCLECFEYTIAQI